MIGADPGLVARANARLGTFLRGKYRLDQVLGIGGMATVYRATHRNGSEFALKLLHPDFSMREDVRSRFLHEGHAASSVKHAGAVQILDDDVAEDGSAFLVMELLKGDSIEAFWEHRGHKLSERLVVGLGLQLLEVLAAAHEHGVIHRDIKPGNLFVTEQGQIKVLDFGIARFRDVAAPEATQAGMMMGTPAFMAPEQAMGKMSEIDARTDLWAVGATLFTLMSGHLVHEGESIQEIMVRAATTRAPAMASALPEVSAPIGAVVDRALAFEKAQRWPNAAAMREALRAAAVATYSAAPAPRDMVDMMEEMAEATVIQNFEPPVSSREGLRMQVVRKASTSVTAVIDSGSVFPSLAPAFPSTPQPAAGAYVSWQQPPPPVRPQAVTALASARTVAAAPRARPAGPQSLSASLFFAFAGSFLAVAIGGGIALFFMKDRLSIWRMAPAAPTATAAPAVRPPAASASTSARARPDAAPPR